MYETLVERQGSVIEEDIFLEGHMTQKQIDSIVDTPIGKALREHFISFEDVFSSSEAIAIKDSK